MHERRKFFNEVPQNSGIMIIIDFVGEKKEEL